MVCNGNARRSVMTAYKVEQQVGVQRRTEARQADLTNYASRSKSLVNVARAEENVDQARRKNELRREAADALDAERSAREDEARKKRDFLDQAAGAVAATIGRRAAASGRSEAEVRRIVEGSEELRELERGIQVAYVNKERAAQHREARMIREAEDEREHAIECRMEHDRQLFLVREADGEVARREEFRNQQLELQKQIVDKEASFAKAEEEARHDKEMVEEIVRKINAEDRNNFEMREKKKKDTRKLVTQLQEEREGKKKQILQQEKEQEENIKAYQDILKERIQKEEQQKKILEEERKRCWEKVVEETRNQTQGRDECEALRDMLWEEELEARRLKEEKDRALRATRQKKETMLANQAQLRAKREMIERQEAEEREMVEAMRTKFAADEAAEADRRAREHARSLQFLENIRGQREAKQRVAELERRREVEEGEVAARKEDYERRVVAEARRRLLEKHATNLRGFLPKGILADENEAKLLH